MAVVRHILASLRQEKEDRRCTTIFQTLVISREQEKKLIIDGGNSMNIVSNSTVNRLKLPIAHPSTYKVAWIDNTSILVSKRYMVSITTGPYSDSIWYDVIPMNVRHILLSHPWFYDREGCLEAYDY